MCGIDSVRYRLPDQSRRASRVGIAAIAASVQSNRWGLPALVAQPDVCVRPMRNRQLSNPGVVVVIRSLSTLGVLLLLISCNTEPPQGGSSATSSAEPVPQNGSDSPAADAGEPVRIQPADRVLTPDGWGPLRIGMSRAEVVAAAGEDAQPSAVGGPDSAVCDEFRPAAAPSGVLVMIQRDTLTRISVSRTSDISTPAGFRVGDSGSDVIEELGPNAVVRSHQYWTAPAKYVTVWDGTGPNRRGIRYEIDAGDRIVHIRGGGRSIEDVEGCV